jgi:hypothetical protein
MPKIKYVAAFAASLVAVSFPTSASWAWFWNKTNTVKAYEACLKTNSSNVLGWFDISERCIEKLSAPVSLDQIEVGYSEEDEYPGLRDKQNFPGFDTKLHVIRFSAKNVLLTNVAAKIQVGSEPETDVIAKPQLPQPEQTLQASFPKSDPDRYYGQCGTSSPPNCVSIKVISAKGFEITVE